MSIKVKTLSVENLEQFFSAYKGIGGFISFDYLANDSHLLKSKVTREKREKGTIRKLTTVNAVLGKEFAKQLEKESLKNGIDLTSEISVEPRKGFENVNKVLLKSKNGFALECFQIKTTEECYINPFNGEEYSAEELEEWTSEASSKKKGYVNPKTQKRLDAGFSEKAVKDFGKPYSIKNIQSIRFGEEMTGVIK